MNKSSSYCELGPPGSEKCPTRNHSTHRRTSRGGEGGCSPPSHRNFWFFSGKTLTIRANVLGRKYSKRLWKPDVCLVKTELKSNHLRIQVFVLEKPYIVSICIVEIHEMKQNPSKRRPTTLDKTCWDTLQKYLFFCTYPDKNTYSRKLKDLTPLPYCNVVYGNRKNAHLGC